VNRLKEIWADPVWSKVISVGIIALISTAFVYFQGWFPNIGHWIILYSQVPNWLIIILCILAFWKIIGTAINFIHRQKSQAHPWKSFRKAKIDGIVWHWDYTQFNSIDEQSILPCCPKCDYELYIESNSYFSLVCKCCNKTIRDFPSMEKGKKPYAEESFDVFMIHIKREIERRLRKIRKI
jgi:hypothetical protein